MYVTKSVAIASVATILVTVLVLIRAHLVVTARNWISNPYYISCSVILQIFEAGYQRGKQNPYTEEDQTTQ
jgi:hypothetical protein